MSLFKKAWSSASSSKIRKPQEKHPFLSGNFAPVERVTELTPCLIEGEIPECLIGGQYIRNGGNPLPGLDSSRESHWFDGDGMLAGVYFLRDSKSRVSAHFVNRFVETDIYLNSRSKSWTRPLIPSIATLISPATTLTTLLVEISRALFLVIFSWIQALFSSKAFAISKLSVANTSIFYHNSRALAACESGPPMVIKLPSLETVEWWTGKGEKRGGSKKEGWAKGHGLMKHLREYTTAHPKIDPITGELLLYHMCFIPPFLRISIIQSDAISEKSQDNILGETVPGFYQPKLMHDFGVSRTRTAILDFPLSLDPLNLLNGKPIVSFDPEILPRIGIFPRREPESVQWITLDEACCVFHVANTWDDQISSFQLQQSSSSSSSSSSEPGLNLLACRLNSATLVYAAGNVIPPIHALPIGDKEKCQLFYWHFSPSNFNSLSKSTSQMILDYEFSLSSIPFEFPTLNPSKSMSEARFIYGTSTKSQVFHAGRHVNAAAKIDCLVKVDVKSLISRGKRLWDQGKLIKGGEVDQRNVLEILKDQEDLEIKREEMKVDHYLGKRGDERVTSNSSDPKQSIKIFSMPQGWYAQEAIFVARLSESSPSTQPKEHLEEDDGYLLFYAFDEGSNLDAITGDVKPNSTSELWILEAKEMKKLVARIKLPNRVPYGLHGTFVSETQILNQRKDVLESVGRSKTRK